MTGAAESEVPNQSVGAMVGLGNVSSLRMFQKLHDSKKLSGAPGACASVHTRVVLCALAHSYTWSSPLSFRVTGMRCVCTLDALDL